jgi:ArsR family metal-binding transcriptional regulator
MSSYTLNTQEIKMNAISRKMLAILERLAEMFPNSSYQSRLDAYLSTKGITDAAQLENYIQQFNSQKEKYL